MKRRGLIKAAGLVTAATGVASPAIAQSAPTLTWRCQSTWPASDNHIYSAALEFVKAVAEGTDNKFKIQVFAAGEIVPGTGVLDAVRDHTVEMAHGASYFNMGKDPAFAVPTCLPFGLNSRMQTAWYQYGGGNDLVNEFFKEYNVYAVPVGNTGTQMGGWFRKELKGPEDLSGLKMRIGGMGGAVWQRLGVVPTMTLDTYQALERGTVDAAEVVGPYDDEKTGLQRIAQYYYYPGFSEGGLTLHLFFNLTEWNKLPAQYQAVIKTAATAAGSNMQAKYDATNPPALRRLLAGGAHLKAFPASIIESSFKAATELYAELSGKSPWFKRLHDHVMEYRNLEYSYWQISELSYDSLMARLIRSHKR